MRYAVHHGFSDFLSRKVGTKKAIRFWETATDVTAKTGRARYELRQSFCQLFGIHRDEIHRVPIIRRMPKGSKEGVLPNLWRPHLSCCPTNLLSGMALRVSIWLLAG